MTSIVQVADIYWSLPLEALHLPSKPRPSDGCIHVSARMYHPAYLVCPFVYSDVVLIPQEKEDGQMLD